MTENLERTIESLDWEPVSADTWECEPASAYAGEWEPGSTETREWERHSVELVRDLKCARCFDGRGNTLLTYAGACAWVERVGRNKEKWVDVTTTIGGRSALVRFKMLGESGRISLRDQNETIFASEVKTESGRLTAGFCFGGDMDRECVLRDVHKAFVLKYG